MEGFYGKENWELLEFLTKEKFRKEIYIVLLFHLIPFQLPEPLYQS
jgi:hypothetical protein